MEKCGSNEKDAKRLFPKRIMELIFIYRLYGTDGNNSPGNGDGI